MNKKQNGNRMYRDALFKYVFGNEEHKEFALSLYNAINHSHYENKEDIILNTLEDVLYMKVKNDVSFLLNQSMVLFEQQSTWNGKQFYPKHHMMSICHILYPYLHHNVSSSTMEEM